MDTNTIIILILIPIISALIGWFTNYIAIKSLFRPYKKVKILGFEFQGVISKRKEKIIKKISKVVSSYLISTEDIKKKISNEENLSKLKTELIKVVSTNILSNLPPMIKPMAQPIVTSILEKHGNEIILDLIDKFLSNLEEEFNVESLIEEKLLNYDVKNLEKIIFGIARDEFRHIEMLGAFIGFVVGLLQVVLFFILN